MKTRNKIYIFNFLLFILITKGGAQNLVMNPSFEAYTSCPMGPGSFPTDVTSWSQPDTATTDYYNACYTPSFGGAPSMDVPSNIQGYQQARTGVAYPGIICRENSFGMDDNWREYVQGQLTSPLVAGQSYCVKFYWSLADLSNYSVNEMGVYLSNTQINLQQKENLPFTPQLEVTGSPLNDTAHWVPFQQNYIATGGEQYIIIGNFRAPSNTTSSSTGLSCPMIPVNGGCFAYYYLDDVSVTPGSCCLADITPVSAICVNDPSIALVSASTGGTWSGPGVNPSTGVFNPAIAGSGTHTIIYTLFCGSDSISILVSACVPLTACQETNGDITATNGTPSYTWYNQTTTQDCSACFFGCAIPPGCAVNVTSWVSFTTGTTIAPSGTYPILFIDAVGDSLQITSLSSLPNCSEVCPTLTVTSSNIVHNPCLGQSAGSFNATTSGGVSPWDYTLVNGGGATVMTFTNVTGTQSFTGLPAGTYTLNVLDSNNCPGTTIVNITQPPTSTTIAAAGPDQSICSNSAVLAGNLPLVGTGLWTLISGTGTITTPSSETSGITGLGIGTNVFEWTISNAPCSSPTSDQVTITNAGGGPVVTINSQTNVSCYGGNNGSATASATGGSGSLTYLWTSSGGNAPIANNLMAGTYTITVTDSIGCSGVETVQIIQPNSITANVNTTPTLCGLATGSATVSASGGTGNLTYSWNNGGATSLTITNIGEGTYLVNITDSLGCTITDSGTVATSGGGPAATITSQINVSCFGENNGYATAFATGGLGSYTYLWNTSPAQVNDTASGLAAGVYNCLITDSVGCQTSIAVTISQPGDFNVNIASVNSYCGQPEGQGSITVSNATSPYSYLWNTSPAQINDTAIGLVAGTYQCIITDANNCKDTVSVTVMDNPAPIVDAGADQTIVEGDSIQLVATGGLTYVWSPANDLSCTNCQSPFASPLISTTYYVNVTDVNGCTSIDSVMVTVTLPEYYFIPNVFSPNNDGSNDLFEMKAEGFKTYHAEIFNRWGDKVFETTDSKVYWNGRNTGGNIMSDGVYFYFLNLTDHLDQLKTFKGFLTLYR